MYIQATVQNTFCLQYTKNVWEKKKQLKLKVSK